VELFAREGARVVATDINEAKLAELQRAGVEVGTRPADVITRGDSFR